MIVKITEILFLEFGKNNLLTKDYINFHLQYPKNNITIEKACMNKHIFPTMQIVLNLLLQHKQLY